MRILFWGTFDTGKPRARILRRGIQATGADVAECHAAIWTGIEDKSQINGLGFKAWLLTRWIFSYPGMLYRFMRAPRPDIALVGYPGLVDVLVLAPFARLRGVPIVWDMFVSVYDTVVLDRKLLRPASLVARLLRRLESAALHRAACVFLDTQAHARRIESLFHLPAGHCGSVWVGVEEEHFAPSAGGHVPASDHGRPTRVLFYGQFIPLHGIETIVAAARLTRNEPFEWVLIGRGQVAPEIRRLIDMDPLPQLQWIDWVKYSDLRLSIATADVCLGIFGTSEKAASVIPNKVFQIVAAGRPLITRDSPAIRELLQPCPPCVYLISENDPLALANAVRQHSRQRQHDATHCHTEIQELISAPAIGRRFMDLLARAVSGAGSQ